jgi:hypothetical protein
MINICGALLALLFVAAWCTAAYEHCVEIGCCKLVKGVSTGRYSPFSASLGNRSLRVDSFPTDYLDPSFPLFIFDSRVSARLSAIMRKARNMPTSNFDCPPA